jgi:hypothetical protein
MASLDAEQAAGFSGLGIERCDSRGNMRATRSVAFYRNVGMIFARRSYTYRGHFCRACIHRLFWRVELQNVVLGPWGVISMLVAPIYFVENIFTYMIALYKLRGALE